MSKVVLVSVNHYDLPGVICVKSFRNLDFDNIDCLIFHSTSDSDLDTIRALSSIKGVIPKIIYINKSINPLYYCIFTGLDADIYDAEESLMDPAIVEFMIKEYKRTGLTIKSPSADLEVIAKGIATISSVSIENLQKLVSNGFWLKTLNTAVSNVDNAISRASEVNINVVDMLAETSKLIDSLEMSNAETVQELEKLKQYVAELTKKEKPNTPFIYHVYKVPLTIKRVLYIKVFGSCRYLNSFILSYQHYLRMSKQQSSKVLFIYPKLKQYMKKYNEVPRLARDSIGMIDLRGSNYFITFEPQKMVLDEFFSQPNVGVFIVVDHMMGDHLLEGHMVKTLYALSGLGDLKRFNVHPKDAILPMVAPGESIIIPHIKGYHEANEVSRRTLYVSKCENMFARLDNIIFS